ncbi:MAG TPA: transporter substrate-binding domain-containing protein [Candidatus Wallbacteria bacterium]|nr:transporter substrate-binding domain-containing protein [Candidatus Wallbacteria bacterium]
MKIGKLLLVLAMSCVFTTLAAGYSEAQTTETAVQKAAKEKPISAPATKEDFSELNGKSGTMFYGRFSAENLKNIINKYWNCKIEKIVFGESLSTCLALLKSARSDFMLTTDITANYIIQRNPEFKSLPMSRNIGTFMILRSSDAKLRDQFNSAIDKIKVSGKRDELYKKWITDLPVGQEPSLTNIEKTADTETIYVGVSGDVPPMDYIAADGKPAGFSVAFLSEISKLTGKNIELVSIDSQARFAALESKKIDVFFWVLVLENKADREKFKSENDEEGSFDKKFAFTDSYCSLKLAFLLKK